MNICVIGTGYVGLVTGAVFADFGHTVICVDNDPKKIAKLKEANFNREKIQELEKEDLPIYEKGLLEMVKANMSLGRLSFTDKIREGVEESYIIFIAVGTPQADDGRTNLSYVEKAATDIAKELKNLKKDAEAEGKGFRSRIIVDKSTVPVGTGDTVTEIMKNHDLKEVIDFNVVSNPEFLKEGSAIEDATNPDRVVIGVKPYDKIEDRESLAHYRPFYDEAAAEVMQTLYRPFRCPIIVTDVHSAEIIKYAANSFLATKISFINMVANLCEKAGANVNDVKWGMGLDKRIGIEFLNAGLGYGGSCFPKDVKSFIYTAKNTYKEDFNLLEKVVEINEDRVPRFISRLKEELGGNFSGKTIGLWGVAFKPGTSDVREAKSIGIILSLLSEGAKTIKTYDPLPRAVSEAKEVLSKHSPNGIAYCKDAYEAATGADAIILVTEWPDFKLIDMEKVKTLMKSPILFDGRNFIKDVPKGFTHFKIGVGMKE